MTQIKEKLDELKPHLIGIRYVEGFAVADVVLKKGWKAVKGNGVEFSQGKDKPDYYMFYSEKESIGFDEILEHIKLIIKLNREKEIKYELLKSKVQELKSLFKEHSLEELQNLRMIFSEEELVPSIMDDDMNDIDDIDDITIDEPIPELTTDEITQKTQQTRVGKVDLPPRRKANGCTDHGPDEFCDNCMDGVMETEAVEEGRN